MNRRPHPYQGCALPLSYMSKYIKLERAAGIEPAPSAWKAEVLPLNYARVTAARMTSRCTPNDRQCPLPAFILPHWQKPMLPKFGGGRRIRTFEAFAADLQSAPFGHSGIPPTMAAHYASLQNSVKLDIYLIYRSLRHLRIKCLPWNALHFVKAALRMQVLREFFLMTPALAPVAPRTFFRPAPPG